MICGCSTQARELGLASMLLCVVMVFLLCNFPAMVVNILEVNTQNILHPETSIALYVWEYIFTFYSLL